MGRLIKVTSNLVRAVEMGNVRARDTIYVGRSMLVGEVVRIEGEETEIQMYENAEGLMLGDPAVPAGGPLSVELGPGLLGGIFDGMGRPLEVFGDYVAKGMQVSALSDKEWLFEPKAKEGAKVKAGDAIGVVKEGAFEIMITVPPGMAGKIARISKGRLTGKDVCATLVSDDERGRKADIPLVTRWPVHRPLPYAVQIQPLEPMITRQRVVDVMFPIARGGKVTLPGGFGVGKTVLGHALVKGSDADIIVYVGCGERGNEMADLLGKFTGTKIMEKMVLIANTSNMPVAAREASIYTGATIAEYYRNMGYNVLLVADSTSRWAEALREISGGMGEMPGEKGFPAYIASRIAKFYERASRVEPQGAPKREGSVTIIGMVSPAGGDFSEPITQASMQYTKGLWALDPTLAYRRHFPAISWTISYSRYVDAVEAWWRDNISGDWFFLRQKALRVLGREEELRRMIQIVGKGALSDKEKLLLDIARILREAYLQQNAYDKTDSTCSPKKSMLMLELIFSFYTEAEKALDENIALERIMKIPALQRIEQSRRIAEDDFEKQYEKLLAAVFDGFDKLRSARAGQGGGS
jgi:V/A-type H+-transporting ATPase subunit A